jgi:hypothetical protein
MTYDVQSLSLTPEPSPPATLEIAAPSSRPGQSGNADARPGHYVYWKGRVYLILAVITSPPTRLLVMDNATPAAAAIDKTWFANGKARQFLIAPPEGAQELLMHDLLLSTGDPDAGPFFAPTREALAVLTANPRPGPKVVDLSKIPANLLTRARQITALVEQIETAVANERRRALANSEPFHRTEALDRALKSLPEPLHRATYYRAFQLYQKYSGEEAAIATGLHRQTWNQTGMSSAQLSFMDTVILRWYARNCPLRPLDVYRIARDVLKHTNGYWIDSDRCATIPQNVISELLDMNMPVDTLLAQPEKSRLLTTIELPSRAWFYNYLRYYSSLPDKGEAVITARYGRDVWESEHMVFDTFVRLAAFPLQFVFMDHWLIELFTVDRETRSLLARLWATISIDAWSRSCLGMVLLYEHPSIDSVLLALRNMIWPKVPVDGVPNMETWTCFGIPQNYFVDNAWPHHSHDVERATREISQNGRYTSIDLNYRPPYKGRYGALIERMIGNLSGKLTSRLPGAILAPNPKAVRNAARDACLLYEDVERFLLEELVTYQNTGHSELGGRMTPEEKWREGMQMGIPGVPPLTKEMDRLFWRSVPGTRLNKGGGKGLGAFGMHYTSETGLPQVGMDGNNIEYTLRYDTAHLTPIAAFREGEYMGDVNAKELRLPDGTYEGVSYWERELAQELARQHGDSPRNWFHYISRLDKLQKIRIQEKKAAHARQRRVLAQSSQPARDADLLDKARESDTTEYDDVYGGFLSAFAAGSR